MLLLQHNNIMHRAKPEKNKFMQIKRVWYTVACGPYVQAV